MKKNKSLNLIQSFRGLAAILVLIHHGAKIGRDYVGYEYLGNIFRVGWIGVDFFFVLSGFIIYYAHFHDLGQRHKALDFYKKRLFRVFPVYWFVTTVLVIMFFSVPEWGIGYETQLDVIIKSYILFPQPHDPILNVGWTLVYEMYFYLLFGLLIFFKSNISKVLIFSWITGVFVNSFGILNFNNFYLSFIFSNYNLEFLMGCLIGNLVLKVKLNQSHVYLIMSIGILGIGLGAYFHLSGYLERYSTESMLVFGSTFSMLVLAAAKLDMSRKITIPSIFLIIGNASYSIYLTHFYLFVFIFKLVSKIQFFENINQFVLFTILIIIVLTIGVIFHLFIEKPLNALLYKKFIIKNTNSVTFSKKESVS